MKTNLRIGEVLMERGCITQEQMEQALAYQKEHREKRVGQILIELGFVTETQVIEALAARLEKEGIRTELDLRNEKIGFKVREAQMMKIPYMLVLGAKEAEAGNISVRDRKGETTTQELDAFINNIVTEIKERRYN